MPSRYEIALEKERKAEEDVKRAQAAVHMAEEKLRLARIDYEAAVRETAIELWSQRFGRRFE